jgi:hypothetical protein
MFRIREADEILEMRFAYRSGSVRFIDSCVYPLVYPGPTLVAVARKKHLAQHIQPKGARLKKKGRLKRQVLCLKTLNSKMNRNTLALHRHCGTVNGGGTDIPELRNLSLA